MGLIKMDDDVVAPRPRRARNIHKSLKTKDNLVLNYHLRVKVCYEAQEPATMCKRAQHSQNREI